MDDTSAPFPMPPDPLFSPETAAPSSDESGALLGRLTVERVESPVFQISARIRQMIQSAELRPGMKLPTTRMLAKQLSVDPSAVHRSLALLVKEGLLVRTPRVGTFVAEPPKGLRRIAYYHRPPVPGHFSNFDRAILTEITRIGHAKGFAVEVFSDTRKPEISAEEPHPELSRHARTRWVQGVVSASVSPERVAWFNSLTIPHATISTLNQPNTFNWSREEMIGTAIRQLAARGCRKIGVICPLLMHEAPGADSYQLGFYHGFQAAIAKLGLPLNPDWLAGLPSLAKNIEEVDMPAFGFDAVNRLWNLPDKPDGLFIYPDTLAGGSLMALAMRAVPVPAELRLVLHTNAELPLFCPFPVDKLVVRAADAANALIAHVRAQLSNREAPPRVLQAHIETHPDSAVRA